MRDFVQSCHRVGVTPGVYIGIRFNAYWQVYQYEVSVGRGRAGRQRQYMRVCEQLVEELCSRYGDWCEIWFDGGVITPEQGGPDVLPIVDRRQPQAVFYHSPARAEHRWAGTESGTTGYPCWATLPSVQTQAQAHGDRALREQLLRHGDADGAVWCPAMCDAPIRDHDWLWVPDHEDRVQPLDALVRMYYESVGRNANLILGAAPDRRGLIPDADMQRYAELGREIRQRFANPVGETAGQGDVVELALPTPSRIDHVILMEDITEGERVREYVVEGLLPGGSWQLLCAGSAIGHKRIEEFPSVEVAAVRFRAKAAAATPRIRRLAAFRAS